MAQLELDPTTVAILVACWVGVALHRGLAMRRYGLRWWVWFVISVFCTVIPAVIVSYREEARLVRESHDESARARREGECPHCGATLTRRDIRRMEGIQRCARCKGVLEADAE